MMSSPEEILIVPKDLDEAKELVNKSSIEDLRVFCFTFGLTQDGTKTKLKERLMEHYTGKRLLVDELMKSVLNLDVPEKPDGKSLRHLYDTLITKQDEKFGVAWS